MKKIKLLFVIAVMSALVSACGPIYKNSYSYQPPQSASGQMCVAQCTKVKTVCEQTCETRDQNCRLQARQKAYLQFKAYRAAQEAHGLPVKKSIGEFDNAYFDCAHPCQCVSHFNSCFQKCGGEVAEIKVCAAGC